MTILLALTVSSATGQSTYKNPVITGMNPDPSICRVGDDFYLVTSTFEFYPGLPIYHSKDLVHWKMIGYALDRPGNCPMEGAGSSGGNFTPALRYNNYLEQLQQRIYRTKKIHGFIGAFIGMYASGNRKSNTNPADFDWFDYEANPKGIYSASEN